MAEKPEPKDWNEPVNLPDDDPIALLRALIKVDPDSPPREDNSDT